MLIEWPAEQQDKCPLQGPLSGLPALSRTNVRELYVAILGASVTTKGIMELELNKLAHSSSRHQARVRYVLKSRSVFWSL
mmetsp:Transcript_27748/g.44487  ORF Transcript_27748/g.44487 Transcript_27748/m.44487 type:complete len:80 (-) Transcript_27748:752-991(-)